MPLAPALRTPSRPRRTGPMADVGWQPHKGLPWRRRSPQARFVLLDRVFKAFTRSPIYILKIIMIIKSLNLACLASPGTSQAKCSRPLSFQPQRGHAPLGGPQPSPSLRRACRGGPGELPLALSTTCLSVGTRVRRTQSHGEARLLGLTDPSVHLQGGAWKPAPRTGQARVPPLSHIPAPGGTAVLRS